MVAASVANGGVMLEPRAAKEIRDQKGTVVKELDAVALEDGHDARPRARRSPR